MENRGGDGHLAPGIGEIIGGSQREERLPTSRCTHGKVGLAPEPYYWCRDLPLRHRTTRRLRLSFRTRRLLHHRRRQRPRRHPIPTYARECALLIFAIEMGN